MNDGVTTRLADNEIRPLYKNDGHEKCRVARVFKHLALSIRLHTYTSNYIMLVNAKYEFRHQPMGFSKHEFACIPIAAVHNNTGSV